MIQGYWKGDRIAPDAGPFGASKNGPGETGQNTARKPKCNFGRHCAYPATATPLPEPCHRREASPQPGSASASQGRDCRASLTPLPTHPFGVVRRHEQVRSWLPSTSPFFALSRVQASASRANDRRS